MIMRRLAAAALAVVTLAAVAGCSDDANAPSPPPLPATASAAPSASAGSSGPSTVPSAASTPVPPPTPGDTTDTVAPRPVETRPPVKLDQPAAPAADVSVRLTRLRAVQAKAQGPGEVSGSGLSFRVVVRNATSAALDLSAASVTLAAADDSPGQLIASSTAPLPASVKAGGSATGTYVFTVPKGQRDPIQVVVTVLAGSPIVAFSGSAPR